MSSEVEGVVITHTASKENKSVSKQKNQKVMFAGASQVTQAS